MPELVEVERYRRLADEVVGWTLSRVNVADPHVLRGGPPADELSAVVTGRVLSGVRRRGKLLIFDLVPPPGAGDGPMAATTLGLRFGMTGVLMLNERPGIDRLEFAGPVMDERWVRLRLDLVSPAGERGVLAVHDPRRLGRVVLDPDEGALGPDALSVTARELRRALGPPGAGGVGSPLKARLMDQARLAGVGNLTADEVLWRAGVSPLRPAGSLEPAEISRVARTLRTTLRDLERRGGSHTGDLMPQRRLGGHCPKDGTALKRDRVGGRTTWWCPSHQS